MEIRPYGDHAILINFENRIDLEVNKKVIDLGKYLSDCEIDGISQCIPAYCSLTVIYDPEVTTYHALKNRIESIKNIKPTDLYTSIQTLTIPVCYEEEYAPDISSFAQSKSLSTAEVITAHSAQTYHVYMLGFLPGFAYMGKVDDSLKAKRHPTPKLKIPAGSIGLAGLQTAIYPHESPGGWQLIGRTPVKVFDERRGNPFLFQVGNKVNFRQISSDEFKAIEVDIILDKFDVKELMDVGH